jgi:hypothetical protein
LESVTAVIVLPDILRQSKKAILLRFRKQVEREEVDVEQVARGQGLDHPQLPYHDGDGD